MPWLINLKKFLEKFGSVLISSLFSESKQCVHKECIGKKPQPVPPAPPRVLGKSALYINIGCDLQKHYSYIALNQQNILGPVVQS